MTQTEINLFRRILENRQTELGSTRKSREALVIETSPDELDRSQHANDRDMAIGNLERDSSRLLEVRGALRRIDASTFGVCIDCDESISAKRLTAVPWTSFCIVCQEAADRKKTPWAEIEPSLAMAA